MTFHAGSAFSQELLVTSQMFLYGGQMETQRGENKRGRDLFPKSPPKKPSPLYDRSSIERHGLGPCSSSIREIARLSETSGTARRRYHSLTIPTFRTSELVSKMAESFVSRFSRCFQGSAPTTTKLSPSLQNSHGRSFHKGNKGCWPPLFALSTKPHLLVPSCYNDRRSQGNSL